MIENLKDLKALLKLCRSHGVTEINLGTVALKLGEMPEQTTQSIDSTAEQSEDVYSDFPDGPLTSEELTFFANGGDPKDNPYRSPQ